MTNHHVGCRHAGEDQYQRKELLAEQLLRQDAGRRSEATDLELNVLLSIKDVTAEVNGAVTEGMPAGEAFALVERRCRKLKRPRCKVRIRRSFRADIVTMFNGGAYHSTNSEVHRR